MNDHVVIEATGNAVSIVAVLQPFVDRVIVANPKQVRMIAHAKIKTDAIYAAMLAKLYATGFLPEVWTPDQKTLAPASGSAAHPVRAAARSAEEPDPVDIARASGPTLPAWQSGRDQRAEVAGQTRAAGG
jgi:hypothetical protein